MRLSWSHKLFFRANRYIGRSPRFDWLLVFLAKYLIFFIGIGVFLFVSVVNNYTVSDRFALFATIFTMVFSALTFSWMIGWLYPRRRPLVEFPEIRELFAPLSLWKAFPSDHTIIAFIFAEVPLYLVPWTSDITVALVLCAFLVAAALVGISRVFAGLHYPRDILGGFAIASAVVWLIMSFIR